MNWIDVDGVSFMSGKFLYSIAPSRRGVTATVWQPPRSRITIGDFSTLADAKEECEKFELRNHPPQP